MNRVLTGRVQSGGTSSVKYLAGAEVAVYQTGDSGLVVLGRGKTDSQGNFAINIPATGNTGIFYAVADLDQGVWLANCVGRSIGGTSIRINELTTVATAFALAQFIQQSEVRGSKFALGLASDMAANLAISTTGESSPVLLAAPNADQSIALRTTRALANLLAACVQNPAQAPSLLLNLATLPGQTTPPATTLQALANIACNPWQNVGALYTSTQAAQSYQPALTAAPDAWTIAVKVNDTGSVTVPFGGPANIAFDQNGYAWITNNVVQGTPVSSSGIVVLQPNGKPAAGGEGLPTSPIIGGGLLGTGFGVAIDEAKTVWVGNFGWGNFNPAPLGMGSVSRFAPDGQPLSPVWGYQGGAERAQAVAVDPAGNIWIASFGNDSVVVYLGGDPERSVRFQEPTGSGPFGIAIAPDGTSAWVTNSGGLSGAAASSVCKYRLSSDNVLSLESSVPVGKALKAVVVDSQGYAWVASGGDNTVYRFHPNGELADTYWSDVDGGNLRGGIDGPWGLAVDGNDSVWVANFGPLEPGSQFTTAALSQLAGTNLEACPPGLNTGDPISPSTGYTLLSAGEPVLLPTGDPLYGPGRPACYSPLMRQTSCVIDAAGNVWTVNNWKPDFDLDMANPGGDGVVIFVGVAKPKAASYRPGDAS